MVHDGRLGMTLGGRGLSAPGGACACGRAVMGLQWHVVAYLIVMMMMLRTRTGRHWEAGTMSERKAR